MSVFRLLLLTALEPAALCAQVIGGRVVDSAARRPLARVVVAALEAGRDSAIATARTDKSGVFYLDLRRPGAYNLRFETAPTKVTLRDSFVVAGDDFLERQFVLAIPTDRVFDEDLVDKGVSVKPGANPPRYPEALRMCGLTGSVLVSFTVDRNGRVEPNSVLILRSTHKLFSSAVVVALNKMEFYPAEFRGNPVRQYAVQPFDFTLSPEAHPDRLPLNGDRLPPSDRLPPVCF